jgi:hypothetical protein
MTFRILDMVRVAASSAPGTGAFPYSAAATGFQTPSAAGASNGDTFPYGIVDGNNREEGLATYNSSGPTISRTSITFSTNGGAAITATASAVLYGTARAQDLVTPNNFAANLAANSAGGLINKFRNGTFDVASRGTSGTVSSGTTAYSLDGWMIAATGAAAAWSQQFGANIAGNAERISCATGLTACTLQQRIESIYAAEMLTVAKAGQPVTVQWAIYNNSGASITPQVAAGYASARDNFGTVTSDLAATNLQTIANGALGVVSYTFTPNANMANGYQVQLLLGGGLNHATGYVDIGQADFRVTPGLSTGQSNAPPPPELRPYHEEFVFCQRYLPAIGIGAGIWGNQTYLAPGCCSVGALTAFGQYAVPPRIAPTGLTQSGSNTTLSFGSASLSVWKTATQTNPPLSFWGGTGSTSWAVLTGAEL